MLKATIIKHFGTQAATAKFLNISPPAVHYWEEVIPERQALKLDRTTHGALVYDEAYYPTHSQTNPTVLSTEVA